jgi:hypothetical protein
VADERKRMGPHEVLLLRGWEANEDLWPFADNGERFRCPRLGISDTNMKEALGLELGKAARELGLQAVDRGPGRRRGPHRQGPLRVTSHTGLHPGRRLQAAHLRRPPPKSR